VAQPYPTGDHDEPITGSEPETAELEVAASDDDTYRYIEHLQKHLIADGWEQFFRDDNQAPSKEFVDAVLQIVAPTLAETDERILNMAREMWAAPIQLTTAFETRMTELRYRPILNEIIEAANELELPPVRPIDLATSTDISCTPMARPTEGRHLLFAGEGTARFCNYWTKAISRVFFTVKALPDGRSQAEWDRAMLFAKPSGIALAAMLAIKYAFEGTMLEFYRVPNIPEETDWRAALLHAMFLFSVAHEYAHFVAYENNLATQGILSKEESQKLEFWCDKLAIKISTHVGRKKGLIQIRTGIGALAFYRALQICHAVKDLYVAAGRVPADRNTSDRTRTHPVLQQRVDEIVVELLGSASEDEQESTQTHVNGCLSMLDMMQELTITLVEKVIALHSLQAEQT
jgi:hypothetical protein